MKDNTLKIKRFSKNPFVHGMVIKTKKARITVGEFGSESNIGIVNYETGEISSPAGTVVAGVREVDDAMFIKLFTQNIALMMDFKSQGNKAFGFLMWAVQAYAMRKDLVQLDDHTRDEFLKVNPGLAFSRRTMYQGLSQLEKAQIIAKASKPGFYFINPNFIFNGDRVRFITEIRRKQKSRAEELEEVGQQRLPSFD